MPASPKPHSTRTFLSPEQGANCPVYDLTGSGQRREQLTELLDQLAPTLNTDFAIAMRRLLNQAELEVTFSPWQTGAEPTCEHWLAAFNTEHPDNQALLGLDNRSLFAMSELFFGGDPGKLSEQQTQRAIADTERRLVNRVFNSLLALLCPNLHLGLEHWQSQWLDHVQPEPDRLWCVIRVSADDWQFTMNCGWPIALNGQATALPSPDSLALREQLENRLQSIGVQLKVDLAALTLNLDELAQLRAGDILPVDLDATVTASAGDTPCLRGQVCEHGDRLALRISDFIGDSQ